MTKMNATMEIKKKSDISPRDIFKSDTRFFLIKKYFNEFKNRNSSVLWLKWTQAIKWNKIRHYFWLVAKYGNILMNFIIFTFQFHCKSEHKQVKWNKIIRDMCKCHSIFLIYKVVHYLNDFLNLFLDNISLKNEW